MVLIDYVPIRGKRSWRKVEPLRIYRGPIDPSDPQPKWLLEAMDLESDTIRSFALDGIRAWRDQP